MNKNYDTWLILTNRPLTNRPLTNSSVKVVTNSSDTKETITKENKPSPIGDAKNMPLKEYNENVSPSEGLEEISSETNELIKEDPRLKKAGKVNQKFWELIKWAENRRGGKFPSWKLQLKALSQLKDADIGPVDIKDRWAELENDKFYKNNLDFRSIAISFDKKPL